MARQYARLNLTPGNYDSTVEVGGQILRGVRACSVAARVHEIPVLTVEIGLTAAEVGGEMLVEVDECTRETLIQLGWTPPSAGAGAR